MNTNNNDGFSRRGFLRHAGALGVAALASPAAQAAKQSVTLSTSGYDVQRFRKVDPKLVSHALAGTFASPMPAPSRISADAQGNFVVSGGKAVAVVDAAGKKRLQFEAGGEVSAVAPLKEGFAVVLRDHLEIFTANGQRRATWSAAADKAWLISIAASERELLVSDAGNRVVHRFAHDGQRLGQFSGRTSAKFAIPSPYFDLELTADGQVWVTNTGSHQLECYSAAGEFVRGWGEPSFAIAGFCGCCNPSYFTRLADGRFVTSEKGLTRVKLYSAEGKFESVIAGPDSFPKYGASLQSNAVPVDVAADAQGRIYVADTLASEICIYAPKAA